MTCRILGVGEHRAHEPEPWDNRILRAVADGKVTRKSKRAAAGALGCSHTASGFVKAWDEISGAEEIVWNDKAGRYDLAEGVEAPPLPDGPPSI